ncbi:hypothetical protein PC9H_002781 [Pleurotus ostreatus]|uniref:Uncharacterized protein n=1 Tax=Pleurotus ostreatus TaxID=5322 RepID=A0A8H7DLJ3_PLEOS|nr:uncharacterized protein PC9H_002781 [Pleurotus ostreatus]KAF7416037.1 hypothetical protein PC9H_002781 [Pleurotus ostreatus]
MLAHDTTVLFSHFLLAHTAQSPLETPAGNDKTKGRLAQQRGRLGIRESGEEVHKPVNKEQERSPRCLSFIPHIPPPFRDVPAPSTHSSRARPATILPLPEEDEVGGMKRGDNRMEEYEWDTNERDTSGCTCKRKRRMDERRYEEERKEMETHLLHAHARTHSPPSLPSHLHFHPPSH